MSLPLAPQPCVRPHGRRAAQARASACVGYWIGLLPPRLIDRSLRLVVRGARCSTLAQAARARAEVCAISARCAGQGCLQRSLAVMLLCRISGHVPGWRTGYRTDPFWAHAWVEVQGHPIAEPPDVASYTSVLSIDPPATSVGPVGGGGR